MTTFYEAFTANSGRTENGAITRTTSLCRNVDFFFLAAAMRGKDIVPIFSSALVEDSDKAIRTLQWLRDIRGGAGERQLFRDCLLYLEKIDHPKLIKLIDNIPEIGRWDDLLVFKTEKYKNQAFTKIFTALLNCGSEGPLAAKWMPRKGPIANELRKFMNWTPKTYRELLVSLTNVVETQMCDKVWDLINFEHVPSLAHSRYTKAFTRNCSTYENYKQSLVEGTSKVKTKTLYPYDITKLIKKGEDTRVAQAMWDNLPNYLEGTDERILPVVDVSMSMFSGIKSNSNLVPIDVSVSLGLYLSDKNEGAFKDTFITFSEHPQLLKLQGTLKEKFNQMSRSNWGYNTDLNRTFNEILSYALLENVPENEMPTTIIVLSDMEFDSAFSGAKSLRNFDAIKEQYKKYGYKMPKIVFWNLNGRSGNIPVKMDERNVAMISGFSPSIMKGVLSCKDYTPEGIMNETIMIDRYKI